MSVRKRLVALIKPRRRRPQKGKPSMSSGAPMPGGRELRPDGTVREWPDR